MHNKDLVNNLVILLNSTIRDRLLLHLHTKRLSIHR